MRYAICGHTIDVDDDERLVFPRAGIRVADLVRYYVAVWPWLERYLRDRPLIYETFFTTWKSPNTFEQDPPAETPRWVKRVRIQGRERDVSYVIADSPATLVYLIKRRMLTLHVWMSTRRHIEQPDFALFDLDVKGDVTARTIAKTALAVRAELRARSMDNALVKTSGRGGLHIFVPLVPRVDYRGVRAFVESIVTAVGIPGGITVDTRQVGRGMSIVPPFSVRACEGAPVSMPVAWDDVEQWSASKKRELPSWSLTEALQTLRKHGDPWQWTPVALHA